MLQNAVRASARATMAGRGITTHGNGGRSVARRNFMERPQCRRSCQQSRPARSSAEGAKGDGISVEVEYSGLWGAITTFPKRQPYATNIIIATVKTSIADLIVQGGEGKKDIDWERNA